MTKIPLALRLARHSRFLNKRDDKGKFVAINEVFENETFENANLSHATLLHCTFKNCIFRHAIFEESYCYGSSFKDCDFSWALIRATDMTDGSMINCKFIRTIVFNVSFEHGLWRGNNLSQSSFTHTIMPQTMPRCNMTDAYFINCEMRGDVRRCIWKNTILVNVNMTGARVLTEVRRTAQKNMPYVRLAIG